MTLRCSCCVGFRLLLDLLQCSCAPQHSSHSSCELREQSWKQDYTNARTSKVEQMKTFTLCLNCRNHSGNSLKLVPCLSWACGLQGSQSSLQTGSCAADPPGISLPPALILREITALGKMVGFCLPNLAQKYSVIICDQQDDTPKGLWFYM